MKLFTWNAVVARVLLVIVSFIVPTGAGGGVSEVLDSVSSKVSPFHCEIMIDNPILNDEEINLAYQLSMLSGLAYADWSPDTSYIMKKSVVFEIYNHETSPTSSLLGFLLRTSCLISNKIRNIFSIQNIPFYRKQKTEEDRSPSSTSSDPKVSQSMSLSSSVALSSEKNPVCPGSSFRQVTFHHVWFLNGWSEDGIWHDTEVLISINADSGDLAIAFRGSESVADLVTSSQLLEPARKSNYFHNISHGSVHRGIFNAYHKVNRGTIVPLERVLFSSNISSDIEIDSSIRDAYRSCMIKQNKQFQNDTSDGKYNSSTEPCYAKVLLSSLLIQTASKALRAGKQVYLTGHSLGGALATFMALDLLINSNESVEFLEKEASAMYNNTNSDEFMYRRASTLNDTIGHPYRVKSLDDSIFKNIHLHTFGEPEIADNKFFHDIFSSFSHVSLFVKKRYRRFVGLSHSPHCTADVVTTLAARIAQVIGEPALGVGGCTQARKEMRFLGFWNRNTQKGKPYPVIKNPYRNELEIEQCNSGDAPDDVIAKSVVQNSSATTASGILTQLYSRLTESSFNMRSVFTSENKSMSAENSTSETPSSHSSQSEVRISYFAPPYYVCSGGASSMLNAHRIQHYVRGIIHRKFSQLNKLKIDHPLIHDVSLRDAQEIDIADDCYHSIGNGFFTYVC